MKEKTIKRLVLSMGTPIFFLLICIWKYSFETFNINKSFDTTCHPENVPTMQLGRILTGGTITVQSPPMYTNLKEKPIDTLDESSADLFSKRLNELVRDENFKKQYERLLHGNEFAQILSDMVIDHEKLKKKGIRNVLNGSHFMNNDASLDWEEAIKKLSSSSDRKDAAGKFTHSNRKKRSRNFGQSDESLNLDNFDDDCAHVDDDLSTFTGSVESLFLKEQQTKFPHHRHHYYDDDYVDDDLSTNCSSMGSLFEERDHFHDDYVDGDDNRSTNLGSMESIFKEEQQQQTIVPHHHHHRHHYHYDDRDHDMSTNFGSVESIFKEPNDDYADDVSTNTYSCKSEYTGTDYYDSYGDLYHVVDQNNEHERANAKAGVHLPMLDEHFIGEYKNYSSSKNFHKRNSLKQKIYKRIPFLRKFFNKIDAKLESEIRRYLDIKEREKQNYPVRKVKGTQKIFNFLSKYRVFVPLGVLGILSMLFLVFLLKMVFSGSWSLWSLLSGLTASVGTVTSIALLPIYFLLPFIVAALVIGGYDLLVLYYKRKLDKIKRSREEFDKLLPKGNGRKLRTFKKIIAD
ncbi:Uncharacterized protein PCOAH_00021870 [Plasmodium coatneyi]|uniref:Pv-fam-d protein n=1 Tax=Plasmodium coatneyi TaxID=208452 RepID=A0A1B1DYG3_9APIC|nr:Uncharacterized protein PCOAH_00021870 [Plasmodium coatneyi]ANQ07808.1 Uncharacterized protein PCOAH_00021870 [Plasmodium coatneyi]